ncbi:MAG: hypothetical protein GY856_17850 [bacterium]|nr:hypothetical protein [bacterium]
MSKSPRFIPENKDGVLVELSSRTVNAWALLRPSEDLNDVTVGVLGRSLEISPCNMSGTFKGAARLRGQHV